jgi:hypothetical protein
VLARATERVAAEVAEIERRILALPNLDARQPAKKSRLMADAGVKLVIRGEDARKRACTTQGQSDSLPAVPGR